jgi:hypothetical protein
MSVIEHLSVEQLDLIPEYQQKWGALAAAQTPINSDRIRTAIRTLYAQLELPAPKIRIFQGPETFYREFPGLELLPPEALRQLINIGAGWGFLVLFGGSFWCFIMTWLQPTRTWMQPTVTLIQSFGIFCIVLLCVLAGCSQRHSQLNYWLKSAAIYLFLFQIFVVSPVLYAWVLRSNLLLAMSVGSLPILVFLCIQVMDVLTRRRLENRWSRAINTEINAQLSQQIRDRLLAAWAVDSLRLVTSRP